MRYVIYIDKLIVLVFGFHILQLTVAKSFFLCTATRRRIILSALEATFLFYVMFQIINGRFVTRIATGCLVSSFAAVYFCYGKASGKKWIKLYFFSASGVFALVSCLVRLTDGQNWFCLLVVLMQLLFLAYIIGKGWIVYQDKSSQEGHHMVQVSLHLGEERITVYALLDSGNGLREPLSGSAVHLISAGLAKKIEATFCENTYRVVPYRSVGCKRGYLDSYRIPFMTIHFALEDRVLYNPVIAIATDGMDETSPYQMILHPDLLLRRTGHVVTGGRKRTGILAFLRIR